MELAIKDKWVSIAGSSTVKDLNGNEVVEEKNNIIDDNSNEEKAGFKSLSNKKKKQKFKSVNKKTSLKRLTVLFVFFAEFFTVLTFMFLNLESFRFYIQIISSILIVFITIVILFATGFMILLWKEFRESFGKSWKFVAWLKDINNNVGEISKYYYCFAAPVIMFSFLGLVFSIIGQTKEKKGYIAYIVIMSINLLFILMLTILYYENNCQIFLASKK